MWNNRLAKQCQMVLLQAEEKELIPL